MAATRDLNIVQRLPGNGFGYKVKGGVRIFGRALVALDAGGLAVPVGSSGAVQFAGIAESGIDNRDGMDGAQTVNLVRDVRGFNFAATATDLNKAVYASDDETLTLATTGLRIGVIVGLDAGLVWVDLSR